MFLEVLISKLQNKDPYAIAFIVSVYGILMCLISFYIQYNIRKWPFVWGNLVENKVTKFGVSSTRADQMHIPEVHYTYEVNGQEYIGKRLSAMVVISNTKALLRKQLSGIVTADGKVKVFYNPKKPQKSYLINGSKTQIIFTLFMLFVAVLATIKCINQVL